MGTLLQDVRYALGMLAKSPGFSAVAVLTLTLGIGANTVLFSVVNGVLLNPLPYPHPEELVTLHESKPNFNTGSISYPNFLDWEKDNHTLSAMAVARSYSFGLTGLGEAEQVNAQFVTPDFFLILDVKPVIGRMLLRSDDQIGSAPVALISAGFWKRKFGSSPDAVGKSMTLDGKDYTIVGVIPSDFDLMLGSFNASDIYAPVVQWTNNLLFNRGAGLGFHGIGRLKPGVTLEQARADFEGVTHNLSAAYPDVDKGIGASLIPFRTSMLGSVERYLIVLFCAVGFVLLIACANIANLLLARSSGRAREFAVRAALGATKSRLIRQLLTESVLLGLIGGTLGLLLATWGTRAALSALPTTLPRAGEVGIDLRVLLFTGGVALLAGIFFGLAPALGVSRTNLHENLKEGGRGASGSRQRAQDVLIVVEMALALVLLIGAGLMFLCFAPALAFARKLVRMGVDAIVIEGNEAGGHIGPVSTGVLAQEILPHFHVPVFVAGGIGRGEAMLGYLEMGASGIQLGTRFVCAHEFIAHPRFKRAFISAAARDAVASVQLDPRFPVIPVRALSNPACERFVAAQRLVIDRFTRGELSQKAAQLEIEHFWAGALRRAVIDGDVEGGSLMAGQSVGFVTCEQSTAEILEELVGQALAALAARGEQTCHWTRQSALGGQGARSGRRKPSTVSRSMANLVARSAATMTSASREPTPAGSRHQEFAPAVPAAPSISRRTGRHRSQMVG